MIFFLFLSVTKLTEKQDRWIRGYQEFELSRILGGLGIINTVNKGYISESNKGKILDSWNYFWEQSLKAKLSYNKILLRQKNHHKKYDKDENLTDLEEKYMEIYGGFRLIKA